MHFIDWFWRIFEYQFYFFVQNILYIIILKNYELIKLMRFFKI